METLDFYEKYWKSRITKNDYKRVGAIWRFNELFDIIPMNAEIITVLEIGAGAGMNLRLLNDNFKCENIIGLDLAKSALEIIKKELPQVQVIQSDAQVIPIKDETIDLVLLIDILEHLEKPDLTLIEAKRIGKYVALKIPLEKALIPSLFSNLKKRSRVGLEHHKGGHLHEWKKKDALKLLTRSGLTIINQKLSDPPESIRYFDYKPQRKKFIKRIVNKLLKTIKKTTCSYFPKIHIILYGSSLFVFCKS
jgi:ubiquinone/menaquinone biosynthesis C-methylase UbiE